MEWSEMPLVPSVEELTSGALEHSTVGLRPVRTEGAYDSADDYVDTYFRLLRADCFSALSKGVTELLNGRLDPRDMNVYTDVAFGGIQITRNGISLGLKVCQLSYISRIRLRTTLNFELVNIIVEHIIVRIVG